MASIHQFHKKSSVWTFYERVTDDVTKVKCKLCEKKISRGGQDEKSHNTTNMKKHLNSCHKVEYEAEEKRILEEKQQLQQKRKKEGPFSPLPFKLTKEGSQGTSSSTGKRKFGSRV